MHMLGRRRRGRRCRSNRGALLALAFGAGLFVALFCSLKLALFLAAVGLIAMGAACR